MRLLRRKLVTKKSNHHKLNFWTVIQRMKLVKEIPQRLVTTRQKEMKYKLGKMILKRRINQIQTTKERNNRLVSKFSITEPISRVSFIIGKFWRAHLLLVSSAASLNGKENRQNRLIAASLEERKKNSPITQFDATLKQTQAQPSNSRW